MSQEPVIVMTQKDFAQFHKETARIAREETQKALQQEYSRKSIRAKEIRILKGKLAAYRQHKRSLTEDIDFSEAEKSEYRLAFLEDLMGAVSLDSDRVEQMLLAQEEKRKALKYEITLIERAVQLYEQEIENGNDHERADWLTVVENYYMNPKEPDMAEIANAIHITERTAYRYLDKGIGVLLEYIV